MTLAAMPATTSPPGHEEDHAIAAATARLATELDLPAAQVRGVARQARHELAGVPEGALPELVERLARERLAPA
jgi:hypothetical protein